MFHSSSSPVRKSSKLAVIYLFFLSVYSNNLVKGVSKFYQQSPILSFHNSFIHWSFCWTDNTRLFLTYSLFSCGMNAHVQFDKCLLFNKYSESSCRKHFILHPITFKTHATCVKTAPPLGSYFVVHYANQINCSCVRCGVSATFCAHYVNMQQA